MTPKEIPGQKYHAMLEFEGREDAITQVVRLDSHPTGKTDYWNRVVVPSVFNAEEKIDPSSLKSAVVTNSLGEELFKWYKPDWTF